MFGGVIAQEIQAIQNYRECEFFRKYVSFIMELKETTVDERIEFSEELSQKAEDNAGNVVAGLVDRLDNINKSKVLACITKAKMHKFISIEEYFRLASVLERIPYVDLKLLPNYQEPFYDEDGDTELLYSTGVLRPVKFSEDGDLFILSPLGINLLKWGFLVEVNAKKVKGATTGLSWTEIADESDVRAIIDKASAEKEYEDTDKAVFDLDVLRGK